MIETCNIRCVDYDNLDAVWCIVRSLKNRNKYMTHVPELSPSLQLFWDYRRSVNNGTWGIEAFQTWYTPRFIAEINQSDVAQKKLKELVELDKQGKRIALACFCVNKAVCHRSIVAKMLRGMGANVTCN